MATVGLSAYAVTPRVAADLPAAKEARSRVSVSAPAKANTTEMQLVRTIDETLEQTLSPKAAVDNNEVTVVYALPNTVYFPKFTYLRNDEEYYTKLSPVIAPVITSTYSNESNYMAGETLVWMGNQDQFANSFTWFYNNGNAESSDVDFSYSYIPSMFPSYGTRVPTLTYDDASYAYPNADDEDILIAGGTGTPSQAYIEKRIAAGYLDFKYDGSFPFDAFGPFAESGFSRANWVAAFGSTELESLNSQYAKWWPAYSDIDIQGCVQWIENAHGNLMNLSFIDFPVYYSGKPGAKFHLSINKVNAQGQLTNEVIFETDYIFPDPSFVAGVEYVHVDLSYDNGVEELNYITLDGPAALMLTGFENLNTFEPFLKWFEYNYYRGYMTPAPDLFRVLAKATNNGNEGLYLLRCRGLAGTDVENAYIQPGSMFITYGLEYPFVLPFFNPQLESSLIDPAEFYPVALNAETTDYRYGVKCPGDPEDITIAQADGDDLPSWLGVVYTPVSDEELASFRSQYGDETLECQFFYLDFVTNDPSQVTECDVVLTYKGATATFHVSSDGTGSGITAPAVDNAGLEKSVELFDLQGRSIKAAPQTGLYLRRATMMDGSVVTTKVAR